MSCQLCGSQNCTGMCRQLAAYQNQQAQMAQQQAFANQQQISNIQGQINQQYQNIHLAQQAMGLKPSPTPEEKFMDLIDGKSDEEIVIVFETFLMDNKKRYENTLEKMKAGFAIEQQEQRDNFLTMCKRFRPSITEEFVKRVCNMKAFW